MRPLTFKIENVVKGKKYPAYLRSCDAIKHTDKNQGKEKV